MYTYHGYLFGHYDSRGGTTFVEIKADAVEPLNEAVARYATCLGYPEMFDDPKFWEGVVKEKDLKDHWTRKPLAKEEWLAEVIKDELLGYATMTSEEPIDPNMDLDATMSGEGIPEDWDCDDDLPPTVKTAWAKGRIPPGEFLTHENWEENKDDPWNRMFTLHYGPKPEGEWSAPRWNDDAYGLLFIPKDQDCNGEPA